MNQPLKVVIAGSRQVEDYNLVVLAVARSGFPIGEIVSGTARGADRLGEQYARRHAIPLCQFPADWERHGKAAGIIRNRQMVEYADAVIVLWDGQSRGSANTIQVAHELGKPCYVLLVGEISAVFRSSPTFRSPTPVRVECLAEARRNAASSS